MATDRAIRPSVHAGGGRERHVSPQILPISWSHIENIKLNLVNLTLGNTDKLDSLIEHSDGLKFETLKSKMLTLKNRSCHVQNHWTMSISALTIAGINIFVLFIIIAAGIYAYRVAHRRSISKIRNKQVPKNETITGQS